MLLAIKTKMLSILHIHGGASTALQVSHNNIFMNGIYCGFKHFKA